MKTQFIFLIACVVCASFALPSGLDGNHSEVRQQQEVEHITENQESSTINNVESINNGGENSNSISTDDTTTDKNECIWKRRRQGENKRRWLKLQGERRHSNSTELNNVEHRHPFVHTSIWQEKRFGPRENLDVESRHHHRHHHHHHHHHHKNITTTTTPPTTTTPSTELSEMEEIAMKRHLTSHRIEGTDIMEEH